MHFGNNIFELVMQYTNILVNVDANYVSKLKTNVNEW